MFRAAHRLCKERGIKLDDKKEDKETRKEIVEELRLAFRAINSTLARKYHPDRNPGEADKYNTAMSAVNEFFAAVQESLEQLEKDHVKP